MKDKVMDSTTEVYFRQNLIDSTNEIPRGNSIDCYDEIPSETKEVILIPSVSNKGNSYISVNILKSLIFFAFFTVVLCSIIYTTIFLIQTNKNYTSLTESQKYMDDDIDELKRDIYVYELIKDSLSVYHEDDKTHFKSINSNLNHSLRYEPTNAQDEQIHLGYDFTGTKIIFTFYANEYINDLPKDALKVEIELVWCSQFVSGYVSLGSQTPYANMGIVWEKKFMKQFDSRNSNQWSMLSIMNNLSCQTSTMTVDLDPEGKILIQSEGETYDHTPSNPKLVSNRKKTEFYIILKGYYKEYSFHY